MTGENAVRVLIVEDNPGDARLLRVWLSESSSPRYRVSHAGHLAEAGAYAEANGYDAVLLDLSLPDSTGVDTVTRFREHSSDAAIVVVSGLEDSAVATQSVHHGAQDYLIKGEMTSRSLRAAISRAVARHRLTTGALKLVDQARASTSRLRGVLHELPDGLVIHDDEGTITYANPAAEALIGGRVGATVPSPFLRDEPRWRGTVDVSSPDGTHALFDALGRKIDGDREGAHVLLLRRRTPSVVDDPDLDSREAPTLRASLDCMAWRVERLTRLIHERFQHAREPDSTEALELAEALSRLLADARRASARGPSRVTKS